jgi:basic amino acid/polyamine antiporter, APA family
MEELSSSAHALKRELGVFGATMMGMGSIVGTGVFVSIGIAAGIAGPAVILAIAIAAIVATCNAFSSAQLAASHPVAGGTYEYGYKYLSPTLGFTAGWMFLCAKTTSAATAGLGFAGYLLHAVGSKSERLLVPVAVVTVMLLTIVVLRGLRQSNLTNMTIVSITLASLITFITAGLPCVIDTKLTNLTPFFIAPAGEGGGRGLLHATALMFVAYTGYGRIATMGEEVKEPRRTIPRAITITLLCSATLYMAVAIVAVGAVGASKLSAAAEKQAAPLEIAAQEFGMPALRWFVTLGAMTAMLGVLLNLILGLSRVLLAMARRKDMPAGLAEVNSSRTTPYLAVIVVGIIIVGLVMIGSVKTTWSFSAFTVLIYYAITNMAALHLPKESRLYPAMFSWTGLLACLFLAFWVERQIWMIGLGLILIGLSWHWILQFSFTRR